MKWIVWCACAGGLAAMLAGAVIWRVVRPLRDRLVQRFEMWRFRRRVRRAAKSPEKFAREASRWRG